MPWRKASPERGSTRPAWPSGIATATPVITGNTYTIQKGDTLYKIARAKYGNPTAVKKIIEANPGLDPNKIKAGQKINLP